MSESPKAYTFCEAHFKKDCPICQAIPKPNPSNDDPTPAASSQTEQIAPKPASAPVIVSDPKIQKRIEAARRYANAVEAEAIISDQVIQAEEVLAALRNKLKETQEEVKRALEETK